MRKNIPEEESWRWVELGAVILVIIALGVTIWRIQNVRTEERRSTQTYVSKSLQNGESAR